MLKICRYGYGLGNPVLLKKKNFPALINKQLFFSDLNFC
jgi:hypothetical protein